MAVVWKKLSLDEEVVRKDLFDANTILAADTNDTPAALTVDASRIVGRKSSGNIAAMTAAETKTELAIVGTDVGVSEIGSATYDDFQDFINNKNSSMVITDDICITENANLDGTVNIVAKKGYIKNSDSATAELKSFDISETIGMAVDNGLNYIYIDYNGGSPVFAKSASVVNHTTQVVIGRVYKETGTNFLHIISCGQTYDDFQHKTSRRLFEAFGFQRTSGIITTESGLYERAVYITAGVIWGGISKHDFSVFDSGETHDITGGGSGGTISANNTIVLDSGEGDVSDHFVHGKGIVIDSSSNGNDGVYTIYSSSWDESNTTIVIIETSLNTGADTGHIHEKTFSYWYYNGSAWVQVKGSVVIDNTQYNNTASGLVEITVQKYGVHWIFVGYDGHVQVVYGQGNYSLSEAQNATTPATLPDVVNLFSGLATKIIIQKNNTDFDYIISAWDTAFVTQSVDNHNDLGALQGGTTDEYYHMTNTQHSGIHAANTDTQLDSGEIEIDADDCLKIKETAYFDAEFNNGDSGSADTVSWKVGNKQKSTLTADCTFTFTAPSGACNLILRLIQDATANWDVTWPAAVKWLGTEPTWADGEANKSIIVSFYFDGTNYWAQGTPWEV